jgi:pyrroloquinoline quinone (PQQ) biosynthesis protein C
MGLLSYDTAVSDTDSMLTEYVVDHPFIHMISEGRLTEGVYAQYLRETYHLVRQTPFFLSAAASYSTDTWLQDWFLDLAIDERHHDQLCVRDLERMGMNSAAIIAGPPGYGAATMIGQNHYLASKVDPAAIVGFAAATEGLGASLGPTVTASMGQYPFAAKSLSFLKVHSVEDQDHVELVQAAFNRLAESTERYDLMVNTWRNTLRAYGQLFSDAVEQKTYLASVPTAV